MTTRLRDIGERELIRRYISPLVSTAYGNIVDDDCAVIEVPPGRSLLASVDRSPQRSFLDILGIGSPADVAHFHVVANVSDIAAMGGEPIGMMLALGLPESESLQYFTDYLAGIQSALDQYSIGLFGGDTKQVAIRTTTITVFGLQLPAGRLSRRGARPGDRVFILGDPIGTILGSYIRSAIAQNAGKDVAVARPRALVIAGQALVRSGRCTSCMDMSDGLLASAQQLAEASGLTFEIDPTAVPFAPGPSESDRGNISQWQNLVANVGSDFGLMFTADPHDESQMIELGATPIGQVRTSPEPGLRLVGRSGNHFQIGAWEQFTTAGRLSEEIRSYIAKAPDPRQRHVG